MRIPEIPLISSARKNHALEHATINILRRKHKSKRFAGYSGANGFWLYTDLSTEEVTEAVTEALKRLQKGESKLAFHPNCGTHLAVSGIAAGLGAFIGMWGVGNKTRDRLNRFPIVALFATIALIITKPLGIQVQKKVTTDPNPGSLTITQITRTMIGTRVAHRITTKG
jgi:hypothetical protein